MSRQRPMREDKPLKLTLIIYDLLPPSRLGSVLNFVGAGVYHSSVCLALPLGPSDTASPSEREYAFGGHATPNVSGVFSLPARTAPSRMPGLRAYMEVDYGLCFGEEWNRVFMPKQKPKKPLRSSSSSSTDPTSLSSPPLPTSSTQTQLGDEKGPRKAYPYSPVGTETERSTSHLDVSSTATVASGKDGDMNDPFRDPELVEFDWEVEDDGGASDGTEYMTRTERRAWRTIDVLRKDESWYGTNYQLLGRNCNAFTDELCYRLTGKRAPGWINRAAWIATSVPCIIPPGWIDEPADDGRETNSSEATVVVVPPRADQMNMGGAQVS